MNLGKKNKLVESHLKINWYVDLWGDGTIEVFTFSRHSAARFGAFHRIHPTTPLEEVTGLPKYVTAMVAEAIELREFEGLGK